MSTNPPAGVGWALVLKRAPVWASVSLAVALSLAAADASAKPGTFAGSIGIKVPKGAEAGIRAVNRATGTVAAARPVGRSGRFSLSLAPGQYLVVGTVMTKQGKVLQKRIGVSLKSGQRRKRSSLKARKRKRRGARPRAAFVQELGNVTPGRLAVELPKVTGSTGDPDWDALSGGIEDFMMTEFVEVTKCGTAVIEFERRAELLKGLEFEMSPYVDPATRPKRNLVIADIQLRSSISAAPRGGAKIAMRIVDSTTGKTLGTRETTLGREDWAGPLEVIAKKISDDICKLSDVYEVTLDVSGEGRFATHSGTGAIHQTLRARRNDPTETVWRASGPLQWGAVTFATNIPECPMIDYIIPSVTWSVTITDAGSDQLQVTWASGGNDSTTASVDCHPTGPGDPDPPPIPGQPGVALLNTGPGTFVVPNAGGAQLVSGIVSDGGDGFFNSGQVTVTPAGVE
jgi:hypothetical protein